MSNDSEMVLAESRIAYLERALAKSDEMLRKAMDDNAVLLRRALQAELRIADHIENKTNPDIVDKRLWGLC